MTQLSTLNSDSASSNATSLLLRLQRQDSDAWEQLVELYGPLIFHWCKQCNLSSADAADVMQDVFVLVSRKVSQFERRGTGSFRGWLWTIARNRIRDLMRGRPNMEVAAGGSIAQMRMNQVVDGMKEADDEPTAKIHGHQLLHRALDQIRVEFSENSWAAFWRNVVEGDPTSAIAEDLGITTAGVRQAKRRILRRLRQQLGDLD